MFSRSTVGPALPQTGGEDRSAAVAPACLPPSRPRHRFLPSFCSGLLASAMLLDVLAAAPLDFLAIDWLGRLAHVAPGQGIVGPLRSGLPAGLQALALSPTDDQLYAASGGELFVLDPATGDVTPQFALSLDIRGMAFSPDGTLYVSSGHSSLYTVDLRAEEAEFIGELGAGILAQGLDFSPDGRLFAIGPYGSTPEYQLSEIILSGDTFQHVRIGTGMGRVGQSLAFAPDGSLYALGTELALLDPLTGAAIGTPVLLGRDFRGLAIVPEPSAWLYLVGGIVPLLLRRKV